MKTLLDFKKYLQKELSKNLSNNRINGLKDSLLELYIFEDLNEEKESQFVYIPDINFKKWILNNIPHLTNKEEITIEEAAAYPGAIDVFGLSISDLTGIEAFTALTYLRCSNNLLTSLNVSTNTALTYLRCSNNLLTSLNVSGATALDELNCPNNLLTSLNVSTNTALTKLGCFNNQLTSLNVSTNTALTILGCSENQLTSMNVQNGNNTNFLGFDATNNPNLTCIHVDNVTWATAKWKNIDKITKFK